MLAFFKKQFPDAVPLMPTLLEDFFTNPTGHLVTIRCRPWHVGGRACLLGDAAHAIVPFFGQGMNCAFEDCTIFNDCLAESGEQPDWEQVFQEFEARRKADADAIADMALDNYFEMRDRVADPKFGLKRDVEFALERHFPRRFIPRYSMVSFHRLPYAMAQQRGRIQDEILRELCGAIATVEELDWQRAEELVTTKLSEFSSEPEIEPRDPPLPG
ncbi:MAG: hypothetical protein D6743_05775 [Calditrichaeota bacterium]|nr:MAG: hypothetical protein D6743_05775 [Calditrichota bacterium]